MTAEEGTTLQLAHWREELLNTVLRVSLPLGGVLSFMGMSVAFLDNNWPIGLTNLAALSALYALYSATRLAARHKALGYLLILTGIGVSLLLNRVGAFGLVWLSAAPTMGALLMGRWVALVVLSSVTALVFGTAHTLDLPLEPLALNTHRDLKWGLLALNFYAVNLMVAIATAVLLRRLDHAVLNAQSAQAEQRLLAEQDYLTGLPNRRALHDRVSQFVAECQNGLRCGALLFIDVDHFKDVNDTYGHLQGDQLLMLLAERLSALVQPPNMVARMGGDEFVVLHQSHATNGATLRAEVLSLAQGVLSAVQPPFEIGPGVRHLSSVSVGVSLIDRSTGSTEDVLREADTAMYQAKAKGRHQVVFFEPAMREALQERMRLEQDLTNALRDHQLSVAVQSQVNSAGELVGAELLARWHHPVHGHISPGQFIPIAEQSDLIVQLGDWMLDEACDLALTLRAHSVHCPLSVNISARQIKHPNFERSILHRLDARGLSTDALIFEVTESLLVTEKDESLLLLERLAGAGLRFSMDDFGTGYSSLSYLKRLPLHELKIDRSFVDDLPDDANDVAIVTMILSMAATLGLRVIAEGVETPEQARFLREHGCTGMQGYLYARPVPAAQWLAERVGTASQTAQGSDSSH